MRRNVFLIVALVVIGLGIYAYNPAPKNKIIDDRAPKTTGVTAPDFSFTSLNNEKYTLKDFKGKLILLHFWASWCAPCVVELPSLIKLAHDFPDDIIILAFSNDNDSESAIRFLHKQSINLHSSNIIWSWDDSKAITYDLFQTMILPETIILDHNLNMVKKYVGDTKWNSPAIRNELQQILKAK